MSEVTAILSFLGLVFWIIGGASVALQYWDDVKPRFPQRAVFLLACGPAAWVVLLFVGLFMGAIWLYEKSNLSKWLFN